MRGIEEADCGAIAKRPPRVQPSNGRDSDAATRIADTDGKGTTVRLSHATPFTRIDERVPRTVMRRSPCHLDGRQQNGESSARDVREFIENLHTDDPPPSAISDSARALLGSSAPKAYTRIFVSNVGYPEANSGQSMSGGPAAAGSTAALDNLMSGPRCS